jgi:hypothetical protein
MAHPQDPESASINRRDTAAVLADYAAWLAEQPLSAPHPRAVDFTEGTWRQPDAMAFEAFVTAPLPRICCPEHGDLGAHAVVGERARVGSRVDVRRTH